MLRKRIILSITALGMALAVMLLHQWIQPVHEIVHERDKSATCPVDEAHPASREAQAYAAILRAEYLEPPADVEYFRFHVPQQPAQESLILITLPNRPTIDCELSLVMADLPWTFEWVPDAEAGFAMLGEQRGSVIDFKGVQEKDDGTLYVEVDYLCPGWCGAGTWYILEEIDSGWRIKDASIAWIS
jgi:hypothetical protein